MSVVQSAGGSRLRRRSSRRLHPSTDTPLSIFVLCMTIMLVAAPMGYLLYGSFRNAAPGTPGSYFTLANWVTVYTDAGYVRQLVNTVILAVTTGALSVLIGTLLAWIVARTNAPGRNWLAPLLIVPLMISTLVTTLGWITLASPNAGFVNVLINSWFGIRGAINIYSFSGMVLVLVLHYSSFAFISMFSALKSIDGSLEEASYMLGGGPVRTAFSMTLRLVMPTAAATFLIIFVFVAENFAVPTILGSGTGFSTVAGSIFVHMTQEPSDPALGATSSTVLLWIALLGTIWQRSIARNAQRYVTISGKGNRARVSDLGRIRYVATAFLVVYLLMAVVLPYVTLILASLLKFVTPNITWQVLTFDNYARLFTAEYMAAIRNSLLFAVFGGMAATVLYAYLAFVIGRSRSMLAWIADYAILLPTVIPALVLGVGFVWAFVGFPIPIYGTMWILVIGYVTRFLGQGVRQARAAAMQLSNELPEAARVAGASPTRTFVDILLPLLKPALMSIWTILFLMIFIEVSLTIMLYTPRTITVSVMLWSRMVAGSQTEAFALAVLQATIVFAVLFVANRLFGTLRSMLNT